MNRFGEERVTDLIHRQAGGMIGLRRPSMEAVYLWLDRLSTCGAALLTGTFVAFQNVHSSELRRLDVFVEMEPKSFSEANLGPTHR